MSGTTNVLIAPFISSGAPPAVHPVYSLDGLGVDDPPVIPVSFGATDTFVDFTYALPTDGNAHIGIAVLATFDPVQTRVLTLNFEGSLAVNFNGAGPRGTGFLQTYLGRSVLGAASGSNWRLIRANAADGAITGNLRIWTFGDADNSSVFNSSVDLDINANPVRTVTSAFNARAGSCIMTVATRNDWIAGRNYLVTSPGDFTYSPTGSAGVGAMDNGATTSATMEFKFTSPAVATPTATWTFSSPQVGERAGLSIIAFDGATY
jgi:hypothetical protein